MIDFLGALRRGDFDEDGCRVPPDQGGARRSPTPLLKPKTPAR
jgi:hypothetical protein